jgi:hypothetical protein
MKAAGRLSKPTRRSCTPQSENKTHACVVEIRKTRPTIIVRSTQDIMIIAEHA